MTDEIDREEKFRAHTHEQYIAVGRFVEAFEQVVLILRFGTQHLMELEKEENRLQVMLILNHSSLTARPLLDIFVGIVAEKIKDISKYPNHASLREILNNINKRFGDMPKHRNNLLHGTWSVASNFDPADETKPLNVAKWTTSKEGLRKVQLPTSVPQLEEHIQECLVLYNIILNYVVQFPDTTSFYKKGDDWFV